MRTSTTMILAAILVCTAGCDGPRRGTTGEPVELALPAGPGVGPRLSEGPGGDLVLSWMAPAGDRTALRYAYVGPDGLGEPRDVVVAPGLFVNWADVPSVMQVGGDHWIAQWLRYSADKTYAYDVVVAQSSDGGVTWSEPVPAHTDGTPTEHGFVSMHRDAEGVSLLWLDGRNTPDGPMTLRSAVITPSGERTREQEVDSSVCDCCQTDVAISSKGPIAVYRDRTEDEIRDIYVARFAHGAWEPGVRLYADNWNIPGCPVNGPSIVADGDRVAVAWFSAAGNVPVVRIVVSTDGGTTFGPPVEVASGRLSGYVGLTFTGPRSLAVSWVGRDTEGNVLLLRAAGFDGSLGVVRRIAGISQARVFPQLGFQDGKLFLIWTDIAGDTTVLKGATIEMPDT